jgi:hypothetical protein
MRKRYWVKGPVVEREPLDFVHHLQLFGEQLFKRMYRICKSNFQILVSLLEPDLFRACVRRNCVASTVHPNVMVAGTIRFLAGAKVLDLGCPYGLAESTVYVVIDETFDAMNSRLDKIHFLPSVRDCEREVAAFQRLHGSPMYGFIAPLDGIAIAIRCPTYGDSADARKFFNRKVFFAISVQAAVSAAIRLCSFHRGMPGPLMTRRSLLR